MDNEFHSVDEIDSMLDSDLSCTNTIFEWVKPECKLKLEDLESYLFIKKAITLIEA